MTQMYSQMSLTIVPSLSRDVGLPIAAGDFTWAGSPFFGGEKIIEAKSLEELDTSALLRVFGKNGSKKDIQIYRDALKKATLMISDKAAYIVLGLEPQTRVDYGMPIRTFLYDGLQYDSQAKVIKEAHIADGDKASEDEFTSGLYKEDRILPAITVVIHFSSKPWDGATRLRDLYECDNPRLLKLAPDYKMNLIDPASMTDEDFDKFSTDMGKVLKFMKFSGDKDAMRNLLQTDKSYMNLSRKAAEVLRECANIKLDINPEEGVVSLCKAWEDAAIEAKSEGLKEGSILSAIDTYREFELSESEIQTKIMAKYNLTEEEAANYMIKKSA